jgi:hypothetical protein
MYSSLPVRLAKILFQHFSGRIARNDIYIIHALGCLESGQRLAAEFDDLFFTDL